MTAPSSDSDSDADESATDTTTDADIDIDYLVLYRTANIDPDNQSRLARELIDDRESFYDMDFDPEANGARASLNSDSGYMMRFVSDDHRHLTPQDILTLPHLTSYPISQETLNTLPATIRAQLETHDIVPIRAVYKNKSFYGAELGWHAHDDLTAAQWLSEAVQHGASPIAALDYYMVEIAGQVQDSPYDAHTAETWAKERNVRTRTITENIRDVGDLLEDTNVPAPSSTS